jgi:hypothetical protein
MDLEEALSHLNHRCSTALTQKADFVIVNLDALAILLGLHNAAQKRTKRQAELDEDTARKFPRGEGS